MLKLFYSAIIGALGAGLVHIVTLFLIPQVTTNDAWARLSSLSEPEIFAVIEPNSPIAASMRALDPRFIVGACRFSLRDGPLSISAEGHPPFWSLSIYNRQGENIFSLNDRIAADGKLNVTVVTQLQLIEYQNDMPSEISQSILAEADVDEGFVVLRAFLPDSSYQAGVRDFVKNAICEPF